MENTQDKNHPIPKRLQDHRLFLAYVKANTLLHDADKAGPAFLKWSMAGGKTPIAGYSGHNLGFKERCHILKNHLPFPANDLTRTIPFPAKTVACEPHLLRSELVTGLLYRRQEDSKFIELLEKCNAVKAHEDLKDLGKKLKKKSPLKIDYSALLEISEFKGLADEIKKIQWIRQSKAGASLFDFFLWHHHVPSTDLKTSTDAPSALQLFTAGTGGCDGIDTGYETEAEELEWISHHVPEISGDYFLLATPFGEERTLSLTSAKDACDSKKFGQYLDQLAQTLSNRNDPFTVTTNVEKSEDQPGGKIILMKHFEDIIKTCFDKSIIRTGRPINDVTLADHSLSSAALAIAQAARVVLETASHTTNKDHCYALPTRASKLPENSDWPKTEFALFSCAVNSGRLDDMALELKDITAIRSEIHRLLESFSKHFTLTHPVGGAVYMDQHGAHVVVPVIGNPAKRWIKPPDDPAIAPTGQITIPWVDDPEPGITQDAFCEWLFQKAEDHLKRITDMGFGGELLTGLRLAKIGDSLNRLAEAIDWSRSMSYLDAGIPLQESDKKVHFFHPFVDPANTGDSRDICPVCRLRFPAPPGALSSAKPNEKSDKKKCLICRERIGKETVDKDETGDIEKIAKTSKEGRLALVSLCFNMDEWLSAPSNAGIFGYGNAVDNFPKEKKHQRKNSFGRLRRLWRTTEEFLLETRQKIRKITTGQDSKDHPFPMRTILLAPQDLQVIVPANQVQPIIDRVVKDFFNAFGRVPGRIPFHISALVFAFRVPIYLVLEAARHFKEMSLSTARHPVALQKNGDYPDFTWDRKLSGRIFCSKAPILYRQDHQPFDLPKDKTVPKTSCSMNGQDQFHAHLDVSENGDPVWQFAGDWPDTARNAQMVLNRICLAEIGSGISLNEFGLASEALPPIRTHDFPLEHWMSLNRLIQLEQPISNTQKRRLRFVQAMRERIWDKGDQTAREMERTACELLWREPGRIGSKEWENLPPTEKDLLVNACLNGMIYLAQFVEKHLKP